jgi:hypothetical protein
VDNIFDSLADDDKESFWGKLDDELDLNFDFAKVVVYEIDSDDVQSCSWESIEPICWINRQDEDSPFGELTPDDILWLSKHIGEEETSGIYKDFGAAGSQTAVVYSVSYSDDENVEPSKSYLTSFSKYEED